METVADFYADASEWQRFKRFRLKDRLSWDGGPATVEAAWSNNPELCWNYVWTLADGAFFAGPIPLAAVFPFVAGGAA